MDTPLRALFSLAGIPAGLDDKQKIRIDLPESPSGHYVLIEIDVSDQIAESNETNNITHALVP